MKLDFLKYEDGYVVYNGLDVVGFVRKVQRVLWSGYVYKTNRVVSGKTRKMVAEKMAGEE